MKYPDQAANTAETVAAAMSSKAPLVGGLSAIASWLTSTQAGVLAGIFVGIVGVIMNWYFKRREDIRRESLHEAYLRKLARDSIRAPLEPPTNEDV